MFRTWKEAGQGMLVQECRDSRQMTLLLSTRGFRVRGTVGFEGSCPLFRRAAAELTSALFAQGASATQPAKKRRKAPAEPIADALPMEEEASCSAKPICRYARCHEESQHGFRASGL